jgi:large subunit ribosomal protein L22
MSAKGYRAKTMFVLSAPFKVRRVADNVRNKSFGEAVAILESLPHRGAKLILKTLKSAVANAISRDNTLDEETLYITELLVNEGPRLKRVWARGRGRRDILLRRLSHIEVTVNKKATAGE